MVEGLRSASLAGIISDPQDAARRIVPVTTRLDGSARKELKVRPGFVPAEDVAKFRPGQGSMRSQREAAQARHQAPVTPSKAYAPAPAPVPAPATPSVTVRRPADFVPKDARIYPSAKTAAVKGGAETSRWASTPSASAASAPAPAQKPTGKPKTTSPVPPPSATPLSMSDSASQPPPSRQTTPPKAEVKLPTIVQPSTPATAPPTIPAYSPSSTDLPPTIEGEWWDDELDSTTDALQGIKLEKEPTPEPQPRPSQTQTMARTQSQESSKTEKQSTMVVKGRGNFKANQANGVTPPAPAANDKAPSKKGDRKERNKDRQKPQAGQVPVPLPTTSKQPKVPSSAPPATQTFATPQIVPTSEPSTTNAPSSSSIPYNLGDLTLQGAKERAQYIANELREAKQLKQYASSGAVLMPEQQAKLQSTERLLSELQEMQAEFSRIAVEIEKLLAIAGK